MKWARLCMVVALPVLSQPVLSLQAQPGQSAKRAGPSAAELAIARGQFDEAEAALYEASRRAPRDPVARGALGSFLAARGQLKVGQVLLEEARLFGGDARAIDERLGHIYGWIGAWAPRGWIGAWAPQSAPGAVNPFWERAAYLAKNPAAITGPGSSVVRLEPNELAGLGRISLDVGGVTVPADIDSRIEGLVLPAALPSMGGMEVFGTQDGATLAVVHALTIGTHVLKNVPARIERIASARIGLDVLAPLTPTFDASQRRLTLHTAASPRPVGDALPVLLTFPGVKLIARSGQAPVAIESAAGRAALRGTRWTFDVKHGAVIVFR